MKILFIDHDFHKRTRSSDFFVELLRTRHAVERLFVDPADFKSMSALDVVRAYDLAVLWQMDFLAPLILARGVRTLVVPMYDASANMPDLHWLWASRARFVNFSRRLHDRIEFLGCRGTRMKYFLPPVPEADRARFGGGLKVLLWQRRPEEGINLHLAETLFGGQMRALHIHDVADNPELDTGPYLARRLDGYQLTISTWFDRPDDFADLLRKHNVLIAPRRAEGIGMTMLEGMSRGMLVIAADQATHDEYLSNWINGVLFNPDQPGYANFAAAGEIGEMAWRTAADGYAKWVAGELNLLDEIEQVPLPDALEGIDLEVLGSSLIRAYFGGLEAYKSFLLSVAPLIERMSEITLAGRIDGTGNFVPDGLSSGSSSVFRPTAELSWIPQNRLNAEAIASDRFVVEGATVSAEGHAWIVGESLTIGFRTDPLLGVTNYLKLHYKLPPLVGNSVSYCLTLNGYAVGISTVSDGYGVISHPIPPQAIKRDNLLTIVANAASFSFGSPGPISLGIRHLELV